MARDDARHRAKPEGYDGAVVMWAVGDAPFTRIEDLTGGHTMASRTPHPLVFTGEWSDILSTVIP